MNLKFVNHVSIMKKKTKQK